MRMSSVEDCLRTLKHFRVDARPSNVIDIGGTETVWLMQRGGESALRRNPLLEFYPNIVLLDRGFNVSHCQTRADIEVDFLAQSDIADMHEKYDMVFCFDTLEHVANPFVFCDHLLYITKPGGHIYLSTLFNFVYHPSPEDYFRFSPKGIERCFADPTTCHHDCSILWVGWESDRHGVAGLVYKGRSSQTFAPYGIPPQPLPLRRRVIEWLGTVRGRVLSCCRSGSRLLGTSADPTSSHPTHFDNAGGR